MYVCVCVLGGIVDPCVQFLFLFSITHPPVAYFPIFSNSDIDHPFVDERNEKARKMPKTKETIFYSE